MTYRTSETAGPARPSRARAAAFVVVLAVAGACVEEPAAPPPGGTAGPTGDTVSRDPSELGEVRVELRLVATLEQPLALAVRKGDDAIYVAEKTGRVVALRGRDEPEVVLDLRAEVSLGGEQGLLGLAFSPDGRFLYVNFTDTVGHTHVTEFGFADGTADLGSRREVLFVEQPFSNHNGGNLVFGPDGYLYVGLGDGGSAGDPMGNAQSLDTLLGKMLRISPRPSGGRPYGIPSDNPFVGREGARPEIWAFGLRNPWRYSFDRKTGDLWIGDVGQNAREEIDVLPAGCSLRREPRLGPGRG